jgi:hypothetical protein
VFPQAKAASKDDSDDDEKGAPPRRRGNSSDDEGHGHGQKHGSDDEEENEEEAGAAAGPRLRMGVQMLGLSALLVSASIHSRLCVVADSVRFSFDRRACSRRLAAVWMPSERTVRLMRAKGRTARLPSTTTRSARAK